MPQGFGYGLVGQALKGAFGRTVQGAGIGMAAGAGYGLVSDRQSVIGGAMSGAVRGAMIGGAVGVAGRFRAFRSGAARYNAAMAVNSGRAAAMGGMPHWGPMPAARGRGWALVKSLRAEAGAVRGFGRKVVRSNNGFSKIRGMFR